MTSSFFFGDQHKIGEKDASVSVMTFLFFGDTLTSDRKLFSADRGRARAAAF